MSYFDVRGASLFFTDEGAGLPPMIFVHGLSCDSHDWSWQLPHFDQSYRLIAIDLRGHGRSTAPWGGYEVPALAADVAALLDRLQCGPAIAVGHSLGGAVAALVAVERPDLIRALVAIDPGCLVPDEAGPGLAQTLAGYERDDPARAIRSDFDRLAHAPATPRALATWHNRRVDATPEHVLRASMAGLIGGEAPFMLRSISKPYLARIECPVLSLYVDPFNAAIATTVFRGPESKTVCFEGSGHWLHQERPAEVNAVIDAWIAGLSDI
jgi:pimeloyl-ACP methyl ester carboxylesterase